MDTEKRRVVVIIDDIDRLDKKEIQSILKLVKLTADFANTVYILSFDEKMVAKAVGEMYEDGTTEAGRSFLEKIIQVPLQIPIAQKAALKKFSFELLDGILRANNIILTESESQRFTDSFVLNFIPKLNTPRSVVRYVNILSFSLPLLKGEVNMVDLMLIEGIKIFYTDLYIFIKENQDYFTYTYNSIHSESRAKNKEERKNTIREKVVKFINLYQIKDNKKFEELLIDLFPVLNEVYHNYAHYEGNFISWYGRKKIGSPFYFPRYFSYAVIEGEISDVEFQLFIDSIPTLSTIKIIKCIKGFIQNTNDDTLISKIRWYVESYNEVVSEKLVFALAIGANLFEHSESSFFGFDTPLGQATWIIHKLLRNIKVIENRTDIVKKIFQESDSYELLFLLFFRIERDNLDSKTEDFLFPYERFQEVRFLFLKKLLQEAGDTPLFEKFPRNASAIFSSIWVPIEGKTGVMRYIKKIITKNPESLIFLLKVYSPFTKSTGVKELYYSDFGKESFKLVESTLDVTFLYQVAIKLLGKKTKVDKYEFLKHKQTDKNLLSQFVYLFNNKSE